MKSNITNNESAKMTTGKGTIQGYNGVAAEDKEYQIILDAQVFGEGQEHHTLQPVLEAVEARFKKLSIAEQKSTSRVQYGGVVWQNLLTLLVPLANK